MKVEFRDEIWTVVKRRIKGGKSWGSMDFAFLLIMPSIEKM
jgi:hypothetical protein